MTGGATDDLAYLAFVGLRPAAIAVALATLGDRVKKVGLIVVPTSEAKEVYDRLLRTYPRLRQLGKSVEPIPAPPAQAYQRVRDWIRRLDGQRVAFHVDPGLGFASAKLTNDLLNNGARPIIISTSETDLVQIDTQSGARDPTSLLDLGLKQLLELYDLPKKWDFSARHDRWGDLPADMVSNLVLPGDTTPLPFRRAYEKGGRLYGLCCLTGAASTDSDIVQVIGSRRLARCLKGLQPQITFCADPDERMANPVLAEAVSAGHHSIRLRDAPNWPLTGSRHLAQGTVQKEPVPGGGRVDRNPPLITWLGPDPSATLTALFAHEPSMAVVIVDKSNAFAREVAARLRENALSLPVGTLELVGATFDGQLDDDDSKVIEALSGAHFNVSPGTRLQAASLIAAHPQLTLWSLKQDDDPLKSMAQCLSNGRWLPLRPVPPLVQMQIACGVTHHGHEWKDIRNPDFLTGCLGPRLKVRPPNWSGSVLDLDLVGGKRRTAINGHCDVTLDCGTGLVRCQNPEGDWLEDLIAACVAKAAAACKADVEIHVGVKIPYSDRACELGFSEEDWLRTDGDLVVRLDRDFFLFDAKTGSNPTDATHRALASARAAMISRFCVPVAVRPWIANPRRRPGSGAAEMHLNDLLNDRTLIGDLKKLVSARRPNGEDA